MAQDVLHIVIRTSVSLIASLTLSSGMLIGDRGTAETFTPPPPGSRDRPFPPEYVLRGAPPQSTDRAPPPYDMNYSMLPDPQSRGGAQMPFDESNPPSEPFPPDNNPKGPQRMYPGSNVTQGFPSPTPGVLDLNYCNLILEAPIPPKADQVPWFCTCTLCKGGIKGPKGDSGGRGLPGYPGSPGSRGLTGPQGRPGFIGHPGIKGEKGDIGGKGDQGLIGLMGRKGVPGAKGDKGDVGMDGRPGDPGPPGEPGLCPLICQTPRGPPGEVGLPGIVGPKGLPGTAGSPGDKGQKGDQGVVGLPGLQGEAGQKGDQGEQGACHCKDGVKGAPGDQGHAGAKGEKGDVGPRGLAGVDGVKGEKGDEGLDGPPGPCSPAIQSAFSARLGDLYPKPNLPVPFTIVMYNLQFHFDPIRGIYKAPVNGTYVFSYNLVTFTKVLKVGLFHNFLPVVKSTELTNLGTISQQVILHLNRGDEVWLQVKDTNNNGMFTSNESSSTFSGFLLFPDSCDEPLSRDVPDPIVGEYSWGEIEGQEIPVP